MNKPLVSILMPVKNTALFLGICLDSILKQSYKNWELIAVDDGSTDSSYKVLEEYSKEDERVKIYKNEGVGIIDALRLAYSKSEGMFLTRMDSDDIMMPSKLKSLITNLIEFGTGHIAVGLVKYFSEDQLGDGFIRYEKWLNTLISKGTCFSEIYKECVIPSPCWMVYRKDFEQCDAFRPNTYPEDYDLTFRFYKNGLKPIPCQQVLHYWRDYATRTSRTDTNYADNTFITIKTAYFLKEEYDKKKNLVIWGAGRKGKALAKLLLQKHIPFYWVCDNPKKIGKHIYDQEMLSFDALDKLGETQSIITVANSISQEVIKKYFLKRSYQSMVDYFFFC